MAANKIFFIIHILLEPISITVALDTVNAPFRPLK